jgi:hypothetical protein
MLIDVVDINSLRFEISSEKDIEHSADPEDPISVVNVDIIGLLENSKDEVKVGVIQFIHGSTENIGMSYRESSGRALKVIHNIYSNIEKDEFSDHFQAVSCFFMESLYIGSRFNCTKISEKVFSELSNILANVGPKKYTIFFTDKYASAEYLAKFPNIIKAGDSNAFYVKKIDENDIGPLNYEIVCDTNKSQSLTTINIDVYAYVNNRKSRIDIASIKQIQGSFESIKKILTPECVDSICNNANEDDFYKSMRDNTCSFVECYSVIPELKNTIVDKRILMDLPNVFLDDDFKYKKSTVFLVAANDNDVERFLSVPSIRRVGDTNIFFISNI